MGRSRSEHSSAHRRLDGKRPAQYVTALWIDTIYKLTHHCSPRLASDATILQFRALSAILETFWYFCCLHVAAVESFGIHDQVLAA